MSIQIRQSFLKEEATKINPDNFKVVKSVTGPNGKEFKIYDLEYYANELDKFEQWFMGDLMIGTIKISRTFEDCEDRISKTQHCDKHFMYKTIMRDTKI